jgi:hypothetical protein
METLERIDATESRLRGLVKERVWGIKWLIFV